MEKLVAVDTNTASFWLKWKTLGCGMWVLLSVLIAFCIIWKYNLPSQKQKMQREGRWILRDDDTWRPCLKGIHPVWLLAFRIFAFFVLLAGCVADVVVNGAELFFYYTQWTFTLVTIYFAYGSLLSICGCFKQHRIARSYVMDEEQSLYAHLTSNGGVNSGKSVAPYHQQKTSDLESASFWTHLFQILFQMTAGAVMLTDIVYWTICFPFLTIIDYEYNFVTVLAHSLNAVMLLGDTALNSLRFPWFRISYFLLWTSTYVIFQWIVHACESIWWPYPFLDVSIPHAPLWYLFAALMHIPCFGVFALFVKGKECLLSRCFPQSHQISGIRASPS